LKNVTVSASLGFSSEPRRQSIVRCGVVALSVVVGCLVVEYLYVFHAFTAIARNASALPLDVVVFLGTAPPYLVYALVLAFWGLDRRHRIAGASCGALAGLMMWVLGEVEQRWIIHHPTQASLRALEWTSILMLPTLLALAWGLARRRGRVWLLGIVVAPALAGVHHELLLRSRRWWSWELRLDQWWEKQLLFIAPVVAAALVCWLIEVATQPAAAPTSPQHEDLRSTT